MLEDWYVRDLYGKIREVRESIQAKLSELKDQPAVTKDGYQVMLSANIELPSANTDIRIGTSRVG